MVTGQVPFTGKSGLSVAMKQKGELPRDPQEINPQVPDDLNKLILRCLEKDRGYRYATVEELKQELDELEHLLPSTQTKATRKKAQTSREVTVTFSPRKLLIPALVLGILVIAVVLVLWQPWSETESSVVPKIENSIAIISFENLTGDEAYDDLCKAVPNLLITNLEDTGFYYVVTRERMQDLLKQIGEENAEFIDSDLGFELCRREGIESIVTGSITRAGDMFAVNVKVIDVETKNLLKSANSKGEGVDSIIRVQIDELSREISLSTGISSKRIEATNFDAMDVTTDSMEAYTYYLDGVENKYYWDKARESLEMAVKLDPTFAYAYSVLAKVYSSVGDIKARDEALERAKSLSGKATEKERLYIEAQYATTIEGNTEKSYQILKQMRDKFPKEKNVHYRLGMHYYFIESFPEAIEEFSLAKELDPDFEDALNLLGYSYAKLGDSEKAIENVERYVSLSPGKANPIDTMAEIFLILGRFEEAITKYSEAFEVDPDFFNSPFAEGYIHALKEDYITAIDRVSQFISSSPSPGIEARGHFWKGFYYYWLGSIDRCLVELESAEDLTKQVNNETWYSLIELLRGMICLERGEFGDGRQHLKNFYDFAPKTQTSLEPDFRAAYYMMLGFLDLREGRIDSARSNADELNSILLDMNPGARKRTRYIYDFFHGEVLLAEKIVDFLLQHSHPERCFGSGLSYEGRSR
jgi:tetratricopeptide (TPR) repeat protein